MSGQVIALRALLAGAALALSGAHADPGGADPDAAGPRWRDPFVRPSVPSVAQAASPALTVRAAPELRLELRAVIYDRRRSLVNISGTILALGETVAGYRVEHVAERSVVLAREGTRITLELDGERSR
jgi:hypothetical protein